MVLTRYPPTLDESTPIPIPPNTDRTQNPAVGTTIQANWPSGTSGRLFWWNDSPYGHTVAFDSQGSTANGYYVPAYHARLITPFRPVNKITYSTDAGFTLSGAAVAPIFLLFIEYHPLDGLPGMPDQITPIAERLSNVGNTVNTLTSPANAFEQDFLTPFVYTGLVATKDLSIPNQVDVTAGIAFLRQADQSVARVAPSTISFLSTVPSTTYFLDLNPDGSWSWATVHSGVANFLTIAQATTDASGNILVVTDKRTLVTAMLQSMLGQIDLFTQLVAQAAVAPLQAFLSGAPGSDTSAIYAAVAADSNHRSDLYVRGSDGYGGFRAGKGNAPVTAHLYAQAGGWAVQEALVSLGGQATAGNFGVPPIVADSGRVAVATTATTTILSFTPAATGTYRISIAIHVGRAGTDSISCAVTFADGDTGALSQIDPFGNNGAGVFEDYSTAFNVAGPLFLSPAPITIYAGTTQPIKILWTDATAAVNDHLSVLIERLS